MTLAEMAKALAADVSIALGEGFAALIGSQDLDVAYARTIETLSDQRLMRKQFPDGQYIPPSP
jgi:hypothetical protein